MAIVQTLLRMKFWREGTLCGPSAEQQQVHRLRCPDAFRGCTALWGPPAASLRDARRAVKLCTRYGQASPLQLRNRIVRRASCPIWQTRRSQMDPQFSNFVSYELLLQAVCSRAVAGRSSEDIQYIVELAERLCELMREVEKETRA